MFQVNSCVTLSRLSSRRNSCQEEEGEEVVDTEEERRRMEQIQQVAGTQQALISFYYTDQADHQVYQTCMYTKICICKMQF